MALECPDIRVFLVVDLVEKVSGLPYFLSRLSQKQDIGILFVAVAVVSAIVSKEICDAILVVGPYYLSNSGIINKGSAQINT